jgi:hypothetical protein
VISKKIVAIGLIVTALAVALVSYKFSYKIFLDEPRRLNIQNPKYLTKSNEIVTKHPFDGEGLMALGVYTEKLSDGVNVKFTNIMYCSAILAISGVLLLINRFTNFAKRFIPEIILLSGSLELIRN